MGEAWWVVAPPPPPDNTKEVAAALAAVSYLVPVLRRRYQNENANSAIAIVEAAIQAVKAWQEDKKEDFESSYKALRELREDCELTYNMTRAAKVRVIGASASAAFSMLNTAADPRWADEHRKSVHSKTSMVLKDLHWQKKRRAYKRLF